MRLDKLHQNLITEVSLSGWLRRKWAEITGKPTFGHGVDPAMFSNPIEKIEALGYPAIDFEARFQEADKLAKAGKKDEAISILKTIADRSEITGIRSKSHHLARVRYGKIHVAIDIDNLKALNTILTHVGANHVVREFGNILRKYFEKPEKKSKVYHPSGDEFAIVIDGSHLSIQEKIKMIIKLRDDLESAINEFGSKVFSFYGKSTGARKSARASATAAISDKYAVADELVDRMKHARRRVRSFGVSGHVFMSDNIKKLLNIPIVDEENI